MNENSRGAIVYCLGGRERTTKKGRRGKEKERGRLPGNRPEEMEGMLV